VRGRELEVGREIGTMVKERDVVCNLMLPHGDELQINLEFGIDVIFGRENNANGWTSSSSL
jgi:hypothetical protein